MTISAISSPVRRAAVIAFVPPSLRCVWKYHRIFTSKTLRGEHVVLEEIDDGVWSVYYGPVLLARFDEPEMKFHG